MNRFFLMALVALLCIGFGFVFSCGDDDDPSTSSGQADDEGDDDDTFGVDDDDDDDDSEFDCSGNVCTDNTTGLMWLNTQHGDLWGEASAHCQNLDHWDYTDWRLPTVDELRTLMRGCPATETGGSCGVTAACLEETCADESCLGLDYGQGPGPDGCYLPEELDDFCDWYWSSDAVADNDERYWVIVFNTGRIENRDEEGDASVLCVREVD